MRRVPKKFRTEGDKKRKKISALWYAYKATEMAKMIAKHRDRWTCQYCGKTKNEAQMQGSHVHSAGKASYMKADPWNIKCLCAGCHMKWHDFPAVMGPWFKDKFPERWDYLESKRKNRDKPDWKALYEENKKLLENYEQTKE